VTSFVNDIFQIFDRIVTTLKLHGRDGTKLMTAVGAVSVEEGQHSVETTAFENRSLSSETASLKVDEQRPLAVETSPLEVEPLEPDGASDGSTTESRKTLGVLQLTVIVFYSVSGE
jgi:hypothetical protein